MGRWCYLVSAEKGSFWEAGADFLLAPPSESRFLSIALLKNDAETPFFDDFDGSRRGAPLAPEYFHVMLPAGAHH